MKIRRLICDIIVIALLFFIFLFDWLSYPEHKFQDAIYNQPGLCDFSISIFGIDETTLTHFGPFNSWSRHIMADVINKLNSDPDEKPAVIAIDVIYSGYSSNPEADAALAEAARNGGNVVFASLLETYDEFGSRYLLSYVQPFEELKNVSEQGYVNSLFDSDGFIRRAEFKVDFEDSVLYSFPYQIYKKYTGEQSLEFPESYAQSYITYTGKPGEFFEDSMSNILTDPDFDSTFFADCVVFIGAYAPALSDAYYTPMDGANQMYGVEIHANVLQMLLEENFKIYAPRWVNGIILVALALAAMIIVRFIPLRISAPILIVLIAGFLFSAVLLFNSRQILLELLYPILALVLIYIYQVGFRYLLENAEKKRIRGAFMKYVDPKLVDKLVESGEADSNEVGVYKDIAVLFVDVRGFTPMSEALAEEPGVIVQILNEYLELTSGSIFNNGGSVDKFIGDATMGLFNGFVPLDDYEFMAIKAAVDMLNGSRSLTDSIREKYGIELGGFGIGINCGGAIVGNLGPSFRKDYTAIGDIVNTSARLESNAKPGQILISKELYERTKDRIIAESGGTIMLKGKTAPVEIYVVHGVINPADNVSRETLSLRKIQPVNVS